MKKKYLPMYYAWMEDGALPDWGLCNSIGRTDELLPLLLPDGKEGSTYWGHEWCIKNPKAMLPSYMEHKIHYDFTPIRQNIVLFLAAINGEL